MQMVFMIILVMSTGVVNFAGFVSHSSNLPKDYDSIFKH